jgi:hypothetical protein
MRPAQVPASNSSARKAAAEKIGKPDTETLAEVSLTADERATLAEGWPDFWKVHAAVERILADRLATDTAAPETLQATGLQVDSQAGRGGASPPTAAPHTAAPEGVCRPCDTNEACPNCTTAYVDCADGNCIACDDAYATTPAALVAVEGVETVESDVLRRAAVAIRSARHIASAERAALYLEGRAAASETRYICRHGKYAHEHRCDDHADRAARLSPVEPETSEPEGGESRG